MESHTPLSKNDIDSAARRIAPYLSPTPVFRSRALNGATGAELFFKMENLIPEVGSFKVRGALNAVLSLNPQECARGVVAYSAGNYGVALAWAAAQHSIPATIVLPPDAPCVTRRAIERWGGRIVESGPSQAARETTVAEIQRQLGAVSIHPFNDLRVIAGQATATRELLRQVQGLETIIAPVGGGGLLSGTALAAHFDDSPVRVRGAEPSAADDAYRSLSNGTLCGNDTARTIANGLRVAVSAVTFPIIQRHVECIVCVSEAEIVEALRMVWEELRTIVEPSGAVAFAAARSVSNRLNGRRVGIIVSGGNVDLETVLALLAHTESV